MDATATEVEESFPALVEELEDIERRRTGSGNLEPTLAMRRAHVERALLERLTGAPPPDAVRAAERVRVDLLVRVSAGGERTPGAVKDLTPGAIFVETAHAAAPGDSVDVEVTSRRGSLENTLRMRARVLAAHPAKPSRAAGLTLALPVPDEGAERRLRRFVDAIIRSRIGVW